MQPWEHSRASRLAGPLGLAALTVAGILAFSCTGLPEGTPRHLGPISVLFLLLNAGLPALAYLLGAWGLGCPLAAWLARGSSSRLWIQLGLGLAAMLWLSHTLGVLGLLSGPGIVPRICGWGIVGIGLILLGDQVVRGPLRPEKWPVLPVSAILWAPALALLAVAAANPPGPLWRPTEYGAFDALSYHLQLPKEWAAGARLWPTDHNVYSFLPSLIEAAYLHLGALMPGPGDPLQRMLGGDGNWVIACQYLHAGIAVIGALLAGHTAHLLALRCGLEDRPARALGVITGAFVLATPWMIVVSSLAYNDAGVTTLMAAGMLAAIDAEAPAVDTKPGPAWARAAAAGFLVGIACGCKPTALFMAGPVVGLLLLGHTPARRWPLTIAAGSLAGLAAIAPWLIRNALAATGNPVFPFATRLFGTAHWTQEQVARYAANHHPPPGTTIGERFSRLFSGQFGLRHEQWGVVLLVLLLGLAGAVVWSRSRRIAIVLAGAIMIQVAAWMTLTHLQSRFLLPVLVPVALLVALGGAALVQWVRNSGAHGRGLSWFALGVLALAPLSQALRSAMLFEEQNAGSPNDFLGVGVGWMTGLGVEHPDLLAAPTSEQFINLQIRPQETPDAGVYLLGDTAPLYFLGAAGNAVDRARSPVIYHTTWDTPPLLKSADPSVELEPAQWSRGLRNRGVRYVLVNYDELRRLIDQWHYFDPALTSETIAAWLTSPGSHLRSIRTWRGPAAPPGTGRELFEIDLPAPSGRAPGAAHG